MRSDRKARKAVVVGAGPVGCLAALALVKQGWVVDIYEGRSGMRAYIYISGIRIMLNV